MSGGAVIVLTQNRIIRRFMKVRAVSPDTAVPLEQTCCRQSWIFRRLLARGVVVETTDGYYLDEDAAGQFVRVRNTRILIITGVLVVIAVLILVIAD
jgi:hypothetical protein